MEKPGCVIAGSAVLIVGILGGSFAQCNRAKAAQDQQNAGPAPRPVAIVGGVTIDATGIENNAQKMAANQQPNPQDQGLPPSLSLRDQAQNLDTALEASLEEAANVSLANQQGISISDADLKSAIAEQVQMDLMVHRSDLAASLKLPADATDADIDAAFKKLGRPSLEELQEQAEQQQDQRLDDPGFRLTLEAEVAQEKVTEGLTSRLSPTDAQLKASFDSFTVKRIFIKDRPGKPAQQTADKVLAQLKGGMSFEDAIAKYSNDSPPPKTKLADVTTPLTASDLTPDVAAAFRKLKPGQTTDALSVRDGLAIYKLVSMKSNPPPDLEKNRDSYAKSYAQEAARSQFQDLIDKQQKRDQIDWKSDGYKALKQYFDANSAGGTPTPDQLQKIADLASNAMQDDPVGGNAAAIAQYLALDDLYSSAKGAAKTALLPKLADAIQAVTNQSPDLNVQLELVDLLLAQKQYDKAADQLKAVADLNASPIAGSKQAWDKTEKLVDQLKKLNQMPAATEKDIANDRQQWQQQYDEAEKQIAEQKAAEAAAQKAAEAPPKSAPKPPSGPVKPEEGPATSGKSKSSQKK